jgi:antitoxin (DNA-binding transcriptional repressor) of toxin-antitoxin stability system
MRTKTVGLIEAQFTEIVSLVQRGTEVILFDKNKALIRLMPMTQLPPLNEELPPRELLPRVLGLHEGQGWIVENFRLFGILRGN